MSRSGWGGLTADYGCCRRLNLSGNHCLKVTMLSHMLTVRCRRMMSATSRLFGCSSPSSAPSGCTGSSMSSATPRPTRETHLSWCRQLRATSQPCTALSWCPARRSNLMLPAWHRWPLSWTRHSQRLLPKRAQSRWVHRLLQCLKTSDNLGEVPGADISSPAHAKEGAERDIVHNASISVAHMLSGDMLIMPVLHVGCTKLHTAMTKD